jgi:hypothetical protein
MQTSGSLSIVKALFIYFFDGWMFSRWIVTNFTSVRGTLHCRKTRIPCWINSWSVDCRFAPFYRSWIRDMWTRSRQWSVSGNRISHDLSLSLSLPIADVINSRANDVACVASEHFRNSAWHCTKEENSHNLNRKLELNSNKSNSSTK